MESAYQLKHLANADRAEGLRSWTVKAAEADSISTGPMPKLSWPQ